MSCWGRGLQTGCRELHVLATATLGRFSPVLSPCGAPRSRARAAPASYSAVVLAVADLRRDGVWVSRPVAHLLEQAVADRDVDELVLQPVPVQDAQHLGLALLHLREGAHESGPRGPRRVRAPAAPPLPPRAALRSR